MARSAPLWMPLFVRDYFGKTRHLTTVQHGAYLLLIMTCWLNCGPVPDDDEQLASITGLPIDQWRKMRPRIAPFFQLDGESWRHHRVEEELANSLHIIDQRRQAGLASGRSRNRGRNGVGTVVEHPFNKR